MGASLWARLQAARPWRQMHTALWRAALSAVFSMDADVLCSSRGCKNLVLSTNKKFYLPVQAAPPPRHGHTAVWDGADALVLYGGTNDAAVFSDVRVLCLASGRWHAPACEGAAPPPRYGHAAALVAANLMLVFGGCDGQAWPRLRSRDLHLNLAAQGVTALAVATARHCPGWQRRVSQLQTQNAQERRTSHAAKHALRELSVMCMRSMYFGHYYVS